MPLNKDIENILDPILAAFDDNLTTQVSGHLTTIYSTGSAEMITWGKTKGGVPIAFEGPPIQGAIDWAAGRSTYLVKGMDAETKRRLAHTISQGIENKRGIPGLARDIRKDFSDMTRYRGELIARTETSNALSQASLDRMQDMGIEGKEWVTVGDDLVSDECEANESQGVIAVGQAFTSGPMAPPQHPDCRCTVAPARLKGKAAQPDLPKSTASQQAEYRRRMDANIKKAARDIKRVNDDFMADKTSLAKNQAQRDAINAELDKKADKVRTEMGF